MEELPEVMFQSMGAAWRQQQAYNKQHLAALTAPDA
jgi:hypothetical protein